MIKTVRNVALATALLGTCALADDTKVKVSGEAEVTYKSEKVGEEQNNFNETEVNLMIEAKMKSGVEFKSKFVAFDGVQADEAADADNTANMETKEAYVIIPLKNKMKLIAGLKENTVYGTDAFDTLDPFWRTALVAPIAKDTTIQVVSKKLKEMKQDDGKGDSDQMVFRVDTKQAGFKMGAKVAKAVMNKDEVNEKEKSVFGLYAKGKVADTELAFEYMKESKDFEGKGYFISAGKEFGKIKAGLAYASLSDGLQGGGDFAVSDILDGNIDSSATKNTSAIVVPVEYEINDKLKTNAVLVKADVLEESMTEFDVGLTYELHKGTEISAVYAMAKGDGMEALNGAGNDKQTNMSVAVKVEF